MELVLVIEYSDIFNEEQHSVEYYLEGISKKTLIEVSSKLLFHNSSAWENNSPDKFLPFFFSQKNAQFVYHLLIRIGVIKSAKRDAAIVLYNTFSGLLFAEYCLSLDEKTHDINIKEDVQIELDIFRVLLIFNSQFVNKQNVALKKVNYIPDEKLSLAKMILNQALVYDEFTNYDLLRVFACQIIKSVYLFEFLQSLQKTQTLLMSFLQYFDCNNWQEYLNKFIPITIPVITQQGNTYTYITIPRDPEYNRNCAFFDKFSLTPVENTTGSDFINIRSKPLYKTSEGVYLVIFSLFLVEKIFKSTYFQLKSINDSLGGSQQICELHSVYTSKFSEEFLFYKTIDQCMLSCNIKLSGKEIREKYHVDGEPDYYVRKGNRIFLFESKDIMIHADVKSSFDYDRIESTLKSKLISDGRQPKAILQIINQICNILSLKNDFDRSYNPDSVIIFPVLVLHDRVFNTIGLQKIVSEWFIENLVVLTKENLSVSNIKRLVIIDIDTLLFNQDLFHDRLIELGNLIDEYLIYTQKYQSVNVVNEKLRTKLHGESFNPFSVFLSNFTKKRFPKYLPKLLINQSDKLFKEK